MKKTINILFIFLLFCASGRAQNIGINNNNPQVALDITGALSLRPDSVLAISPQLVSLDVTNKSFIKFSTVLFSFTPRIITFTPGKQGQLLTLEYLGTFAISILDKSLLSNGGRILMNGDFTTSNHSIIQFVYLDNSWKETGRIDNISNYQSTYTRTYNTEGSSSFTVPGGITSLKVYLWGAAGGGGGGTTGIGGNGGFVSGTLVVTPGETLTINVGNGGDTISAGITYIKRGSTYLALAGAGGNGSVSGGNGGSTAGIAATLGTGVTGGFGQNATLAAGGAGGNSGTDGSTGQTGLSLNGGNSGASSIYKGDGFGGDGWFGGGGSGSYCYSYLGSCLYKRASGGGGAGSNYAGGLSGTIVNGIFSLGNSSPYYTGCCNGGVGSDAGQHGRIVIEY